MWMSNLCECMAERCVNRADGFVLSRSEGVRSDSATLWFTLSRTFRTSHTLILSNVCWSCFLKLCDSSSSKMVSRNCAHLLFNLFRYGAVRLILFHVICLLILIATLN